MPEFPESLEQAAQHLVGAALLGFSLTAFLLCWVAED